MHIRALITLAISLILGGLTVFLINQYLKNEVSTRAASEIIQTTPVVVAASDIKSGTRLEKILVKVVDWPTKNLPKDTFATKEAAITDKPPIVLSEIKAGEPILPYKLSKYGARGGLPAKIPEDRRAITIAVNEVKGVAGFIMPGDFVDVLHTTNVGRLDEKLVTRVIMQNVQVLGIDQVTSEEETKPKVVNAVTLLVKLYDAQRLTLAQHMGSLNLVLRNEFDANLLEETAVTYKELLTVEPERAVKVFKKARRKPVAPSVEVIRGLEVTKQKVKAAGENITPAATETKKEAGETKQ